VAQACRNAALRVCDSAWMDKRFWSGAILVATVVVAGASALPGLLLDMWKNAEPSLDPKKAAIKQALARVTAEKVSP